MEKCFQFQMYLVKKPIHQTHSSFGFTSMDITKISPSTTVTPPSSARTSNSSSIRTLIACHSSLNRVEVVTACSWTQLVVAADMPVLVEFWAPWCGPSQTVDEVAKEYVGKALCYKLNIEEYPNVALQYGITSIPTILFYKNGENREIVNGVVSKSTLCAILEKYLC